MVALLNHFVPYLRREHKGTGQMQRQRHAAQCSVKGRQRWEQMNLPAFS